MSTQTANVQAAPNADDPVVDLAEAHLNGRFVLPAFLASLVGTVVLSYATPLLGVIGRDFGVSAADVAWVSIVISLSAVASLSAFPRLGDRYGHRPVITGVLGLIIAGAVVAATAGSFGVLLVGLGLQATGASLTSLGAGLVRRGAVGERLGRSIGLLNLASGIGNAGGFLLGGVILESSTLDTLFWAIGGGALALLVAIAFLAPGGHVRQPGRVDVAGTALLAAWLVALILGLARGDVWGWSNGRTLGCLVGAAIGLALWVRLELRVADPVVDLRFVGRRANGISMLLIALAGIATQLIAVPVVISQSLPAPFGPGDSVLQIAVLLLFNGVGIGIAGPIAGGLTPRIGSRPIVVVGMTVLIASGAWLATTHSSRASIIVGVLLLGLATGAIWSTLTVGLVDRVGARAGAVGGSLQDISIQIGFALAGPINIVVLASQTVPGTQGQVPADSVFTTGFAIAAGIAVLGLALTVALLPGLRSASRHPAAGRPR